MRLITPIRRSCKLTASAFKVFRSKFIAAFSARPGLILIHRIQRLLFCLRSSMCPDERLDGRYKGTWYQQKIQIESAQQIQQGVKARNDLAGLNPRDMRLGQSNGSPKLSLAPASFPASLLDLIAQLPW